MVTAVGAANVPPPQNFQSLLGTVPPSVSTPVMVSFVWMVSVAPELSATLAGTYGIGLPITFSGCAASPLRLMMRPTIRPVTPDSTGVFTHSLVLGVTGVGLDALPGTTVAPALSPCQPLLRPTSPWLRRSVVMVIRPPRFGTSCHIRPLDFDMSIGLTMKNVAM